MRLIRFVVLVILAIPFFSSCGYNKMVELREGVDAQWAQVENVYQRRADLIPNLVNTVKGYAAHEQETLEGVVEARSKATGINLSVDELNDETLRQFQEAQEGLSSALSRLMVVVEQYPDLKANQNFLDLQAQLEGTENRIAVERNRFNEATRVYNTYISKFPQVIMASLFKFERKPYFEAQSGAEKAPEVQF
ncbi:LemA family protein [Xiashengella succiniciproducens]|jgi:LemA protein|uniref:LemA family protein n=1 Tax=Xiashengella succiniciproducens TaxID=2949635 RepID=A0A9J6ZPK1_9BACT|nr:LemA family protein [Alkaliflexus sp. Ai-910]MDI9538165.1 LemA family protein [Bacteroidota bacterium]URW79471.1 LemA family protein [Alkaliflexus sp. Ai-910]HHT99638.1 LemA family protein [Bacteroidales bacterium]